MKKKLIILTSIIFSLLLVMSVGVFAYFQITSNEKTININHNFDSDTIEVDDYNDLFNYSTEKRFNDNLDVDELNQASRKTLKFIDNIVLTDDLFITSNISFDLNGKNLYLNGHNIVFTYNYYGTTEIYSNSEFGYIIPNEVDADLNEIEDGKLGYIEYLSKNNVLLNYKNIKVKDIDNTSLTTSDYIKTIEYSPINYSYDIFNMVASSFEDDYFKNVRRMSYSEMSGNSNIRLVNKVYNFNSKLFIDEYMIDGEPYFDFETLNNTVSFVTDDIDLPLRYLNDADIKIEYESSDEEVLDNHGKVLDKTYNDIITLTVTVKNKGVLVSRCIFYLYVFDETSNAKNDVIKASLYAYLKSHYDNENDYFTFEREIVLPKTMYGVDMSYLPYRISSSTEAIALFDGDPTTYLSLGNGNVISIDDLYYSFVPTSETRALAISYGSEKIYIKTFSSNLVVNNETSIARALINDWYGGVIELGIIDGENHIYESQTLYSYADVDRGIYPEITSLSYEIINDNYELYQLSDVTDGRKLLSVQAGKIPEHFIQNAILSINMTVNEKDVNIQIGIIVKMPSEDTQDAFLPYYTYYDELFKVNYNNYISKSFEMPFSYNNLGPIIVYDFAILPDNYEELDNQELTINTADTDIFTIKLYYNKEVRYTFTFTNETSYTLQLNTFLGTSETKRAAKLKEILEYGDAKYIFELNPDNVASKNVRFGLIYNYKNNYTSNGWIIHSKNTTDEQIVTKVTIAGILKMNIDVFDEVFYKWIYDHFNTVNETYDLGDYASGNKYILVDTLNQNVDVDVSVDSSLSSISDFRGLQYLVGTRKLKLVNSSGNGVITNAENAITIAREIAKMENLEYLDLSGCTGFSDGKDVTSSNDYDNDSISRFVGLRNLKYLNLNGCNIILFRFLESMNWLSEVHVVNQQIYSNQNYNNFFGNTGIVNYQVFNDLTDSGVKVYNTKQGEADVLFERDKSINDYIRIKNGIVYQSILKNGINIENLYHDFSTNPDDYLLASSYSYVGGSGSMSVSDKSIEFRPVYYNLTNDIEVDTTKLYYVKDSTSASGYTRVIEPVKEDLTRYYESVSVDYATAFEAVYSFTLTNNTTSFDVNLIIKFNIERY